MATDALPERRRWQLAVGGVLAAVFGAVAAGPLNAADWPSTIGPSLCARTGARAPSAAAPSPIENCLRPQIPSFMVNACREEKKGSLPGKAMSADM